MDKDKEQDAREFAAQITAEAEAFETRIMRLPANAGQRRETTFQRDVRVKRFNAHGCGG
jgi:hypothetical protein